MTKTQAQIIQMLNEGSSYSVIQEELQVSSKTISATKKAIMESGESSNDRLSSTPFQRNPDPPPKPDNREPNNHFTGQNNFYQPQKTNKTMTNYNNKADDDDTQVSKIKLEKLRLQLEHDRETQKLEAISYKDNREYRLKEQEIQLKRDELEAIQIKKTDEKRTLLFRLKKLTQQCEDDEYTYEEVEAMLDEAEDLLPKIEEYCFINEIEFEDSESQLILYEIKETLDDFLESTDEGESNDLEFEESLLERISAATFQKF
jgi:hypothetical protein